CRRRDHEGRLRGVELRHSFGAADSLTLRADPQPSRREPLFMPFRTCATSAQTTQEGRDADLAGSLTRTSPRLVVRCSASLLNLPPSSNVAKNPFGHLCALISAGLICKTKMDALIDAGVNHVG